jgi:hypothetical protein
MTRKLPIDAFDAYYALGPGRSYQAVATKYGVSKRAVVALAVREAWQQRIVDLERKARERVDTKVVETIEAMQEKHLKTLQVVLGKALEALRSMPLTSAMEAVRAIEIVVKNERVIRGEPGDRSALDVEALIKREYATLMVGDEGAAAKEGGSDEA